ncbi:MAG: NUDIX domain-containing protein [Spirochaetales bacterium]|nr:NUDIX domain-containing protein [Spirochaetales bacterium]
MKYPELTVSAIIFNKNDEILLCRSHKWDNKYIIPGGHVEYGEKLEDALRREILEETSLQITDIKLLGIKECFYSNEFYKERHFLFIDYTCKTDSIDVVLNDEAEEFAWVSLNDLSDYQLGGFTDSLLKKLISKENEEDSGERIFYNHKASFKTS